MFFPVLSGFLSEQKCRIVKNEVVNVANGASSNGSRVYIITNEAQRKRRPVENGNQWQIQTPSSGEGGEGVGE